MYSEDIQIHQNQVRLNLTKSLIDQKIYTPQQFNEEFKDQPNFTTQSLINACNKAILEAKKNPEQAEEIIKSFNDEINNLREVTVEVPSERGPRLETRYLRK